MDRGRIDQQVKRVSRTNRVARVAIALGAAVGAHASFLAATAMERGNSDIDRVLIEKSVCKSQYLTFEYTRTRNVTT